MPAIEELGKKVKAKYPGAYDDMDDRSLGLKIQSKFPGAYDDFSADAQVGSAISPTPPISPPSLSHSKPVISQQVGGDIGVAASPPPLPPPSPMGDMGRWGGGPPIREPKPIAPPPMRPTPEALAPVDPGRLAPTVELSPTGQAPPPVPGRIPGMERLGGAAPGIPTPKPIPTAPAPRRPMGEEYMGPNIDEYVIGDDPTVPAFVRGLSGGTVGMAGGVMKAIGESRSGSSRPLASGPNFAGLPGSTEQTPGGAAIQSAGEALTNADESVQATFARDASIKDFMADPKGAMSDPRWWMDATFSAAGSMAPMAAAGTGVASAIGRVAGSSILAPEVATVAMEYGPAVAASMAESAQVYGSTYNEARKAGLNPELSREAAALVAAGTGLTAIPAHKVGIFNDEIRSLMKKVAVASAAEGTQEGVQTWLENTVAKAFYDPNRPLLQGVPEAVVGAAITGGALGSGGVNEVARNPEAEARAERGRRRGRVVMTPQGPSVERLIRDDLAVNPVRPGVAQVKKAELAAPPPKSAEDSAQFFASRPNVVDRKFKENLPIRRQEQVDAQQTAARAAEESAAASEQARIQEEQSLAQERQRQQERQRKLIEERRQRRESGAVVVPQTGPDERVQRVMDARDRLAKLYFDKPFKDLANSDRIDIDELVAHGEGFAVTEGEMNGGNTVGPLTKPAAAEPDPLQQIIETAPPAKAPAPEPAVIPPIAPPPQAELPQQVAPPPAQPVQPIPAPGPREEVVQPKPVDAAAPGAEEMRSLEYWKKRIREDNPDLNDFYDSEAEADQWVEAAAEENLRDHESELAHEEAEKEAQEAYSAKVDEVEKKVDSITSILDSAGIDYHVGGRGISKYVNAGGYTIRVSDHAPPVGRGGLREDGTANDEADFSIHPGGKDSIESATRHVISELKPKESNAPLPPQAPPPPGFVEDAAPAPVQAQPAPETPDPVEWQDNRKQRRRVDSIDVDPMRFQYKVEGVGQKGVSGKLKDVQGWNERLAGTVQVWRDPENGRTYVINGHHRVELARRVGQPDIAVEYVDAKTASEARAVGALTNIGEGNGTAVDAAKFMRDTGMTMDDIKRENIPLTGAVARDGVALANLAPSLFDDVIHGNIKSERAAIVGAGLDNYDDQKAVVKLANEKKATDAEVREMIRLALAEKQELADTRQGEPVEDEVDLFGNKIGAPRKNTIYEKSQLSTYIQKRLSEEKKIFGLTGTKAAADRLGAAGNKIEAETNREIAEQAKQAEEAYNKLSGMSGPISKLLREGAERIANGEKADAVKESIYGSVRDEVAKLIGGRGPAGAANVRAVEPGSEKASPAGVQADRGEQGLTGSVERTKDGLQETLVTDREAKESQIAAKNDRTTPLAEVPFSLSAPEAPAPTGPDPRQESMFGNEQVAGYAPKGNASFKPGTPSKAAVKQAGPPNRLRSRKMVSRSEIIKGLSHFLHDIPIRTGMFHGKSRGVRGIFDVRQSVIRSAKALDLETISHEIGHAIHKYLWGTDKKRLSNKPFRPFKKELGLLDYDQKKKRPFEGFAEYIRLRITDPRAAIAAAPHFNAHFNSLLALNPDLAKVLDHAQEQYKNWDIQPGAVKIASSINVKPTEQSFWDKFTEGVGSLSYNWIDDKIDIKKAVDLFQKLGATVTDVENAYRLARMLSGSFTRANMSLDGGRVNAKNEVDGPGLTQILKPIKNRPESQRNPKFKKLSKDWDIKMADDGMDDLRLYLVALRMEDYHNNGLETGFTKAQVKEAIDATETPELNKAAQAIHDYSDGILQYLVDKGAMSQESADMIRSKNEFYVPLYRVMDNEATTSLLGRKMLDVNSPVIQRKGSTREIIDPLESIVRNTYAMFSYADRNAVAQALVKQAGRVEDQGWLVESGIVRPMKKTEFNLSEVEKQIKGILAKNGIDASGVDFDTMAAIYRQNLDPKRGDGIVSVVVDGTPQLFQMDKNLIRGLDSMSQNQADVLWRLMSNATGVLRFGATAGNPEFILTNWNRDQWSAFLYSRNGYIPYIDGILGALTAQMDPAMVDEWRRNGGATAAMMPLTRDNLRKSIDRMTMDRKELLLRHPLEVITLLKDALTFFGSKSEEATRLGEYRNAKRRGKTASEAAFDSRDVTLDFERMGHIARIVNRIIPFFSVSLNAAQRFTEAHNHRNPKMAARAVALGFSAITIPSLMLWWLNKDDEKYKRLEDWKKDLFWLIPTKGTGLEKAFGPFFRLAKPPIFGQMYGSAAERIADSLYSKNPHAFDGFSKTLIDMWTPPMTAQAFKPVQEVMFNYNEFTDRPIETDAMKKRSSKYRYTGGTSETAKQMSRAFNNVDITLSPAQIEHLMLGYTAGLGRFAITTAEEISGARKDRPAMGPADRPILKALSTPNFPFFSANYKLYSKELRSLSEKQADYKFTKDPSDKLSGKDEARLKELRALEKKLSEIRSQQYVISKDKTLSRDQKTDRIDALYEKRENLLLDNKRLFSK